METFNTNSGFSDLDGSCVLDGTDCESYTSNNATLGTTTNIQNQGGPFLSFTVRWTNVTPPRAYQISAGPDGTGWSGNATNGNDNDKDTEEPWAATATGQPAVAAKGY